MVISNKKLFGSMLLLVSTSLAGEGGRGLASGPEATAQSGPSLRKRFEEGNKRFLHCNTTAIGGDQSAYDAGFNVAAREITKQLIRLLLIYSLGCIGICAVTHFFEIQLATFETITLCTSIASFIIMQACLFYIKCKKEEADAKTVQRMAYLVSFLLSLDTAYLLIQLSAFSILSTIGLTMLIFCISCFVGANFISRDNLSGMQRALSIACSYTIGFCLFLIGASLIEWAFGIVLLGPLSWWFITGAITLVILALSTACLMFYIGSAQQLCEEFGKTMQGEESTAIDAHNLEALALLHAFGIFLCLADIINSLLEIAIDAK